MTVRENKMVKENHRKNKQKLSRGDVNDLRQ